jgi:hypothetical protein
MELAEGFAAVGAGRQHGVDLAPLPGGELGGKPPFDLAIQQAFEAAIAAFAQGGVEPDRQAARLGDRACGLARAQQVAGNELVDVFAGQGRRQRQGLAFALRVQCDVEVALQPAFGVPRGFAVPDQEDGGGRLHEVRMWSGARTPGRIIWRARARCAG